MNGDKNTEFAVCKTIQAKKTEAKARSSMHSFELIQLNGDMEHIHTDIY